MRECWKWGVGVCFLVILEIYSIGCTSPSSTSFSSKLERRRRDLNSNDTLNVSKTLEDSGYKTNETNVMLIPSRAPDPHFNTSISSGTTEENLPQFGDGTGTVDYSGQPKFDDLAVQRAMIVVAGLAFLIILYLGGKFFCLKKKKVVSKKKYGRIESEMDLLDELEDETDEEEELFDLNSMRRTHV